MQIYTEFLKERLGTYFDIEENYSIGNNEFNIFAAFNQRNAKYMMMKNLEIYAFKNNEYVFYKKLDRKFLKDDLLWLKTFLNENIDSIIQRDNEHMSSVVTFIFEAEVPDNELEEQIKKFKYYKSYAFGLKGWVNGKVMLINSMNNYGISNKLGKEEVKRFIMQ